MSHYFSTDNEHLKSNPQVIAFRVHDVDITCLTDHGVFSKNNLDRGTEVMLNILPDKDYQTALDLGCGYGVVGIYLTKKFGTIVDFVDVNPRALELTKENLTKNQIEGSVFESNGLDNVSKQYDLVITNPPIRAGKEVIYRFFEDAKKHLKKEGEFILVINKKHGALSALNKLETIYSHVETLGRKKGFSVYKCKN